MRWVGACLIKNRTMEFKQLSKGKTAPELYSELRSTHQLTHIDILEYLFTLHLLEPSINKAEKRLLKLLYLGTNGKKITKAMIRGVDSESTKEGVKALNAESCEKVFCKYRERIISYNQKIK